MSIMRLDWAGALGTTINNLVAGEKFEFLSRPAVVKFYLCTDTGTGVVEADITLGNVVVGDNLISPLHTATLGPERDKHLLARAIGRAGDRIQVRLRETGGSANSPTRLLVEIDEIA